MVMYKIKIDNQKLGVVVGISVLGVVFFVFIISSISVKVIMLNIFFSAFISITHGFFLFYFCLFYNFTTVNKDQTNCDQDPKTNS